MSTTTPFSCLRTRPTRRRDLLLGLGQGALLLAPFVRAARARAAGRPAIPNFMVFFTPNGFSRASFGTDGNDAAFKPRRGFEPVTPMLDHISVVRGLSNKSQHTNTPFHDQLNRLLTTVTGPLVATANAASLDQRFAELAGKNPINLKVYWSRVAEMGTFQSLSWKKPSFPNRNENDPRKAYTAVFGSMVAPGPGGTAELQAALDQKKSVLDFLRQDIGMLRGRLPTSEKARLDVHLDSLTQAEKRIVSLPAPGGPAVMQTCSMDRAKVASTTAPPNDGGAYMPDLFKAHGDVQASLLIASIACGARNAGTILWQGASGGINPNGGMGAAGDHHELTHDRGPLEDWIQVDRWYSGRFASFLQEVQAAGILDDTIIVWCSETAERHSFNNCTFVVAGGKNFGIQHRKTVTFPFVGNENGGRTAARDPGNRSISDLWTTLWRAGGGQGDFGEDVAGPITQIWSP